LPVFLPNQTPLLKTLRRVLFYLVLSISVLLVALIISVFLFKERIINEFIREANKQLSTPVTIGKIEVSVFEQFPHLSIVLNDVYVEDSHPGKYPLLTAKRISFQMNPIEVWAGKYSITGLRIEESETTLKLNAKGESNYTVVKAQGPSAKSNITFELNDIDLTGTRVRYADLKSKQDLTFTSQRMKASMHTHDAIYDIEAEGELTTEKLQIEQNSFINGKSFMITSHLIYDDVNKSLTIEPSTLKLKHASFAVTGDYKWKTKNQINIETKGKNTDIQTLISLLPESIAKKLEKYQSKGDVYFSSKLRGEISSKKTPSLSIDFGFSDATVFHPEYNSRLENASMEGSFASSDFRNLKQAALVLKNIKGKLNNENFTADFIIQDFVDPEVICHFKGKVDAPAVLSFYPIDDLKNVSGSLLVDLAFEGKIGLLKNKTTAQRVSTQGTVALQNINLEYGKEKIPLQKLNGDLQFSNNDLALSNVSGKLGHSDFLLNGFFKNIITFVLFENQPIGVEADVKADFIDLDEIFSISFGDASQSEDQQYTFSISKNVNLNFNCDVRALQYKRFHARQVKGDLLVKNEMAVSRNLTFKTMGGDLQLSGIVDANNNKAIDIVTTAKLTGIHLDSVFYVFENFKQDFIEHRHLKGQTTADVVLELTVNEHLKLFPESLIGDIGVTIRKGELNNFEPMKKLSRYLDDEGLNHLQFSDLKNDIHIEKSTVYIPQMEIRSNVTDISISGTHSFSQQIDYRLVTPLRKKKPRDSEAQLAIEEDPRTGPKLFLKITGTTENYKIAYDTEAVKKKIVSDFKREVKELKDAFKHKGKQKQKEVELQKDDYFDWDQN
jgi:hypothetical protein